MTTRADEARTPVGEEHRPTVVVGVDGSPGSRAALAEAMRSASSRGARLRVIAVYEPPEWRLGPVPGAPLPSRWELETELLHAVRGMVTDVAYELGGEHRHRPEIDVEVVPGDAGEILVDAARGADELVVGHRGRGAAASALLGSVGWACVLHAPCPVRVIPAGSPAPSATGP
jgi:nucleotide-binding universal stress UspA family protein